MFNLFGVLGNVSGGGLDVQTVSMWVGVAVALSGGIFAWYKHHQIQKEKRRFAPSDEQKELELEKIRLENEAQKQAMNKDLVSTVWEVLDKIKEQLREQEESNTLLMTKIDTLEYDLKLTYGKVESYEKFIDENGFNQESILKDF